eukprot:912612-Pelagomonas_calceolata.AAC.1
MALLIKGDFPRSIKISVVPKREKKRWLLCKEHTTKRCGLWHGTQLGTCWRQTCYPITAIDGHMLHYMLAALLPKSIPPQDVEPC